VSPKLDLDYEDVKLREAGLRDLDVDIASATPKYGLRGFHHQLNACINRQALTQWGSRYAATVDRHIQTLTYFLAKNVGTPSAKVTPQMVHREVCERFTKVTSGECMAPLTSDACSESGVFAKCSEMWTRTKQSLAECARRPDSQPGSTVFQVRVAEECIALSEALTQVLISSVPVFLRELAATIAGRVMGVPLSEEVLANPSSGIPPEAYVGANPLNIWRFDKERSAFEMALSKKLNESASTVTAMAMTITAELIGPRSSFEQHLESIVLQVLIRSTATIGPSGHAPGWFRLDQKRLPKESAMVAHYRARINEDMENIRRARTLMEEVVPGATSAGESVAELTPRIEFFFSKGDSASEAGSSHEGSVYGGGSNYGGSGNLKDMLGMVSTASNGHRLQQIASPGSRTMHQQYSSAQQGMLQQANKQAVFGQHLSPMSNTNVRSPGGKKSAAGTPQNWLHAARFGTSSI